MAPAVHPSAPAAAALNTCNTPFGAQVGSEMQEVGICTASISELPHAAVIGCQMAIL